MDTPIAVIEKFLEEAVILDDFSHANVLPTLAVCIPISDKPQVVLPYMANGDLKSLIQMEHLVSREDKKAVPTLQPHVYNIIGCHFHRFIVVPVFESAVMSNFRGADTTSAILKGANRKLF